VEVTFEAMPSVLFDGVIVPDGGELAGTLGVDANALDFLRQAYRHGKPLLGVGDGVELLVAAGVALPLPDGSTDPGVVLVDGGESEAGFLAFKEVLARRRTYERETDPPRV